ncbi:MAG: biotin/lipoate A/B protein ligase family protein [bacterium]
METKREWRLIDSGYRDAYTNMAIDEAVFLMREKLGLPSTLRFYGWKPAAISIGYFQRIEDPSLKEYKRQRLTIVRRFTGGGAILHRGEITYSLACSAHEFAAFREIIKTQKLVHEAIILGLQNLGMKAELKRKKIKRPNPYFCFVYPSKYDVVEAGRKIVGSAQRRKNRAFFQHGSILIDNKITPKGIKEKKDREKIIDSLIWGFEKKLGIRLLPGQLTKEEVKLSHKLKKARYSTRSWNYRR